MDTFNWEDLDALQLYPDPSLCFGPGFPGCPDLTELETETSNSTSRDLSKHKPRVRASRACIQCRSRHLKCDSTEPVCNRCQIDGKECVYMRSRRGGRHKPKPSQIPRSDSSPLSNGDSGSTASVTVDGSGSSSRQALDINYSPFTLNITPKDSPDEVDLISLYYDFFNGAHPIVLPRPQLESRVRSDPESFRHVMSSIRYIGSVYNPYIKSEPLLSAADAMLNAPDLPLNAYSVQALLLYAIARHCGDDYEIADRHLDKAVDIALSIGMNRKSFAVDSGEGDSRLEESWRRTFWALYIADGLFSAINHQSTHRLQKVELDVDLPCEDSEYKSGNIPHPRTLKEYDYREFVDEEIVFSSFTYHIDATRILSSLLDIHDEPRLPGDRQLMAADAKLFNWFLYLPKCKQDIIKEDQSVDEVMFSAHIAINVEKMLVHRPYSQLHFSEIEAKSKCTPPSHKMETRTIQKSIAMHTAKTLEAIEAVFLLFALPTPHIKHSPTVTCGLALIIMAQVSVCSHIWKQGEMYNVGRDRVRLGLGAIRTAMGIWGMARRSARELVSVSKELLGI
ncbi:hypothetical protein F5884DRAFT_810890 [Xylogone sp. PMI_703]|nr:hypothetical protein F5884DRAFT_810890 [Xylogone sp. PMI_703]